MKDFYSPNIRPGDEVVTVRIYEKIRTPFAEGGLVAAEQIRAMGRGGDEILVHVNPEEFQQMQQAWGEPSTNPDTGLPEYGFFSKVKKVFKKIVKSPIFQTLAPIALNFLVPGLGVALGGALGASGAAAGVIGQGLIGAGVGALGGGAKGALAGAIGGAAAGGGGKLLGGALGAKGAAANALGSAIAGGASSKIRGGSFTKGALTGGALAAATPYLNNALEGTSVGDALNLQQQETLTSGLGSSGVGAIANAGEAALPGAPVDPNDTSTLVGPPTATDDLINSVQAPQAPEIQNPILDTLKSSIELKNLPKTLAAVGAIGQLIPQGAPDQQGQAPPNQQQGPLTQLPQLEFNRTRKSDIDDYYTYGTGGGGEFDFFEDEEFKPKQEVGMAEGGALSRYVQGPGGAREDMIDAKLSDGEYVFDAETVALLGDGSSDAGAAKLDELRKRIRQYKGEKLAEGEISDDAPEAEDLMGLMDDGGEEMVEEGMVEKEMPESDIIEEEMIEEPEMATGGKVSSLKGVRGVKALRQKRKASSQRTTDIENEINDLFEASGAGNLPPAPEFRPKKTIVTKLKPVIGDKVRYFDSSGGGWITGNILSMNKNGIEVKNKKYTMEVPNEMKWDETGGYWSNKIRAEDE